MRKLISMSMVALLLSVMASTAVAGNAEECEFLKDGDYSKGLYGLCIAWHNAGNDNARASIERAFEKKATGPNDPTEVPGSGPDLTTCPCLDALAAINDFNWGENIFCETDSGNDLAVYVNPFEYKSIGLPNLTTYFMTDSDGVTHFCGIDQTSGADVLLETTLDEYDFCLDELQSQCPAN